MMLTNRMHSNKPSDLTRHIIGKFKFAFIEQRYVSKVKGSGNIAVGFFPGFYRGEYNTLVWIDRVYVSLVAFEM